jgi:3-phenylpropionate/trans-cinnamate dioxygenase ferredoxin component
VSRERVCSVADVPAGEVRAVVCGERSIALANVGGELHAIDNLCTHDGGPLGDGRLDGNRVLCPRHGAAFDARSGRALTLPAVRGVRAYEVTVEGDDVYVTCDE